MKFFSESNRMERMLKRFMFRFLDREKQILSVGCGMGSDVIALRKAGFQAWGLDPSRLKVGAVPDEYREYFRVGSVEEYPFGEQKFDFVYALDVIEHVGCKNFGTILNEDAQDVRGRFMQACLGALAPEGSLLLTTSNKLCPVDLGHWHKYHWFGKLFKGREKFGISIPWSRKNFLMSYRDIVALIETSATEGRFSTSYVPAALYPGISEKPGYLNMMASAVLNLVDHPLLIGSPLAPVLIVRISKSA